MKKLMVGLVVLLVTGCTGYDAKFKPDQLTKGQELCEVNGGVHKYYLSTTDGAIDTRKITVHCTNGGQFTYKTEYIITDLFK
jgi:hypothetical protein